MKNLKSSQGFTLIEIMIAVGVSSLLFYLTSWSIKFIFEEWSKFSKVQIAELDMGEMRGDLKFYFDRGKYLGWENTGAAKSGFLINKKGAIGMIVNLKPCTNFDPTAAVATLTRIEIQCCDAKMKTNVTVPNGASSTEVISQASACVNTPGLSITSKDGKINYCYSHIREMDFSVVAWSSLTNNDLYDLTLRSNASFVNNSSIIGNRYLTLFASLANTGSSQTTFCSQRVRNFQAH